LADRNNCRSIAFCCISTGVFCFPIKKRLKLRCRLSGDYIERTNSNMEVMFNVFKDEDYEIYKRLLG
ncbi:MAG: macro domain-containing protein, partial [Clostridium sp.]|nr:macro domain-containing protein [Clostridium sp.]